MEIPQNVYQGLRDAGSAWNRLLALGGANRAKWSDEQFQQLSLIGEILKQHHSVLNRLIEANQ